jgi:hypothetical protein
MAQMRPWQASAAAMATLQCRWALLYFKLLQNMQQVLRIMRGTAIADIQEPMVIIIIIINPCKPYLTASAPRLTHWGGGK